jgi:D-glycero-D-manno-heptose 1,7-bisphosphate phosphatase
MVDGIVESLKKITGAGYEIIIVSNQGGVGKGLYKNRDVKFINDSIRQFFKTYGINILDVIYCPHHHDFTACICRKPDSLMIEKMLHMYQIDPEMSWMIGDNERDKDAGLKAGLKTLLIESNDDLNIHLKSMGI